MRNIIRIGFVLLCICITPCLVSAGDFDGSAPLICIAVETHECASGEDCLGGTPWDIGMPRFLKIDFKKKTISGRGEGGDVRTTKIKKMEHLDGRVILHGVQRGLGWNMAIAERTGNMTLTATGDEIGFVVFGECIATE
ncbi:MAG: hypothetical protein JRF37_03705 [Deltaproteobacteria bacterium]|nr:hypothetical protein [Deltaproteobacteria bacterium]